MPRIVGDWTLDKLKIIEQYLPAYLTATQRALERVYIDAFAGPGRNEIKGSGDIVDGSPLIGGFLHHVDRTTNAEAEPQCFRFHYPHHGSSRPYG